MPFSVKATLVAFQADPEHYPCHACLHIGDEVIWDGQELHGKMCPDVMPLIAQAAYALQTAGPRYKNPGFYNLFWYAGNSAIDLEKKKYDGNGFRPILEQWDNPSPHVCCLQDPNAFHWPPAKGRPVMRDVMVMCPDSRTGACFKVEAFDLATAGYQLPYTRREITIMDRIAKAGGSCAMDKIIDLYNDFERDEIYPPLTIEIVEPMVEELETLDFVTVQDGVVSVTEKGVARVARYKTEIPTEDAEALKL